jgi:hypothetical protein
MEAPMSEEKSVAPRDPRQGLYVRVFLTAAGVRQEASGAYSVAQIMDVIPVPPDLVGPVVVTLDLLMVIERNGDTGSHLVEFRLMTPEGHVGETFQPWSLPAVQEETAILHGPIQLRISPVQHGRYLLLAAIDGAMAAYTPLTVDPVITLPPHMQRKGH